MAHWAKIDEDNNVVEVIVTSNEEDDEGQSWILENLEGTWIQTSINTLGGIHYDPSTGEPSADQSKALRGNFAGIGMVYDPELDAFYAKKPFESWILNESIFDWEPPIEKPETAGPWIWDEENQNWSKIS